MSQRAKRPNRSDDGSVPVKRRKRTAAEEEEAASLVAAAWQPRSNDLKSIYNRTTTEAPAELFRKDLISAMKLPDSEPLASNEYWVIVDQWKQEWERGVQVPVNPDSLPEPSVTVTHCTPIKLQHEFKLPKNKYIRITKDENFKIEEHALSSAPAQAEAACSYDLDECDVSWLKILNSERAMSGQSPVYEDQLERVIEQFELSCWDKIQSILRNEEGLGIEYDENVICDVCRSPDSEEGNEMVFCDSCNICVHQACYGITRIPEGQWWCCTCNLSKRPKCVLCPNKGGAMKCTRSGQKWAHVSCALWIPEVSIGCVEKMEPITKISSIPASRWALICVLCRERVGACIQCSVKTCKTAYHVTCAFKHGLEMRAIIEDENADDGVKLRSYCEKHSKSSKKEKSVCSGSEDDDSKRKKRKDMTSEEKNQARAARLQEIEAEFYKHVSIKDVSLHLDVDNDALHYIYNYWKLKRKAGNNKPLLPPKSEDVDMLSHKREQADLEKMKMFVQLRQDLERVRNLCYMVSRREKLSRSFFRLREQTFHKQAAVLELTPNLPNVVVQAVIEANHGPSIYDRLYSHEDAEDHTTDFDTILARIAGIKSPTESGDEKKTELNGLFKDKNPYKKVYFNGTSKRRSGSLYGSSTSNASSSDERPKEKENRLHPSSSEEEKPTVSTTALKKKPTVVRKTNNNNNNKATDRRRKRHSASSRSKVESSSEEDNKQKAKRNWGQYSRSRLMQVERELGYSGSDSDERGDELMPIHSTQKTDTKTMSSIYSDSDSSDVSMKNDDKSSNAASDSQQNRLRTKAAVKEFSHKPSTSKSPNKGSPENKKKNKTEIVTKKENPSKKKDYVPSDLIVPQRQAAKKATENLKSTTSNRLIKEQAEEQPKIEDKSKVQKPKAKVAAKETSKEPNKKDANKQIDVFDIDKEMDKLENQEILAYVPQRQAAKKAAEHIKSGLGKPVVPATSISLDQTADGEKKKELEGGKSKAEAKEKSEKPARVPESKRKSSSNSSSSSSSSSSSDSSTTSTSDSDDEPQKAPPPPQQPRSESLFSNQSRETAKRTNAKDWPFLDKGAKPAASSSSSDTSDSSRPPSPKPEPPTKPDKIARKINTDKKPAAAAAAAPQREEQARLRGKGRPARGRSRPSKSSDRVGDANVRTRDLSDSQRGDVERERAKPRKGKPDEVADRAEKETPKSGKLQSPVRKTDKKLNETEVSNLEKEILERKAGKQGSSKTKSTLDRLFGPPDKKVDKDDKSKSPNKTVKQTKPEKSKSTVKENKEPAVEKVASPVKKSPVKSKNIDEIFTQRSISNENKIEIKEKNTPKREEVTAFNDNAVTEGLEPHKSTTESYKSPEKHFPNDLDAGADKKSTPKLTQEYQNRSIFSPPHMKDLDFDNLDDGFGISKDEEIMKGPLTFSFGNTSLFKEDSKEDSARETLNLVEKLRMELSKKSTSCDVDDGASVSSSTKNESDRTEFSEQVVPNSVAESNHKTEPKSEEVATVNLEMRVEVTETTAKTFEPERNQDYRYLSCEADVPLEQNKNIPIQQHHGLPDHGISGQGDERWVPPSDAYAGAPPPVDPSNFENQQTAQHYIQQYSKNQTVLNALPPQVDLRLHEDTVKGQSPTMHDRRISQTPLNDPGSMDCMPSPSPYTDMHPQAKWADSEIMPNRRSSSSSAASSSSSCSRRDQEDDIKMRQDVMMVSHPSLENIGYLQPQGIPFPPETFPAFSETSQFVSPVSLFPPPSLNTSLAFPPTGPAMFPPAFGAPFPAPHSVMPTLPKPVNETMQYSSTCTATFTSSQHNMALTAAMVNLPPTIPKDLESPPEEDIPTPAVAAQPEEVPPSPAVSNSNVLSSPSPSIKSNSSAGKKSPSKPTRTSARVTSQLNKSPNKSPGKSPRQELVKQSLNKGRGDSRRNSVKTNASRCGQGQLRGRGRGRGRGRTHSQHNDYEFVGANTIHNKLVGTVYDLDFDDDISNDNMTDLKSMRERRKSVDVHERKSETAAKDSSQSPKFASPSQKSTRSYNADLRELRPPTPVEDVRPKAAEATTAENERPPIFPDMVQPVLPGPVDMRTYSGNFDQQTYNEANLLRAFATGTTETQVHEEIDEDFEKELQTALTTPSKKPEEPPAPEVGNIKVSLSDSRNQLKVKIKGPIANYSSTIPPLPPPTVDPVVVSSMNFVSNNVISNNSIGVSSGTSNLRRMRKKELLRQYWTQDMNMDDSSCATGFNATPAVTPVSRTIITIPKAVASMTSIPTKDDYRDYRTGSDDVIETKQHRKETKSRPGTLSRELRQLDLSLDEDGLLERRRSIGSVGSNNSNLSTSYDSSLVNKRRGRPPRPSQQPSTTPKIKIKIGNSIVGGSKVDDKRDRIRPPKKRLATINMPSVEDLKRESMKFRKLVMADFGEGKEKRKKKDKSEKRKRKKSKPEVQIISNESQNPTKLIIRIGKKVEGESAEKRTSGDSESNCVVAEEEDGPKMTPIKLKLSRCQEGSGYVMKRSTPTQQPPSAETKAEEATQPGQPPPSPPPPPIGLPGGVHAPPPLPLNKDCEVR
ncbi:PHD finger protein rhinoceros [Asbolus verrucosus]|uniref:PHD finger protein rhinoceros n=1 Tax=Asbolus verrucosus TaxID=1661398 RepID=A0A482VD66_ASBVE|nr:PHD finger protein rhinoceros [Asbolus verrucosus]